MTTRLTVASGATVAGLSGAAVRAASATPYPPVPSAVQVESVIGMWWPLLLSVGGAIMAFAVLREQVGSAKHDIDRLRERGDSRDMEIRELLKDIWSAMRRLEQHMARIDERTRLLNPTIHGRVPPHDGGSDVGHPLE